MMAKLNEETTKRIAELHRQLDENRAAILAPPLEGMATFKPPHDTKKIGDELIQIYDEMINSLSLEERTKEWPMPKPNEAVTKSIDDLLKQIDEAFSGIKCPSLEEVTTIWHTRGFEEFYENGAPDDWHDLSADILECHPDTLSLLEPRGFLFFFPAYMRHGLLEYRNEGTEGLIWYCVQTLAHQHEQLEAGRTFEQSDQTTQLLSQEQKKVIRCFLAFAKYVYLEGSVSIEGVDFSDPKSAQLIDNILQDQRMYLNQP